MQISESLWERWQLTDVKEVRPQRVYQAQSRLYGPVIVKQESDPELLRREYETLSRMAGMACRVYDREVDMLLEERILPGTSLREEKNPEIRLEVLVRILENLHTPESQGQTYLDWLDTACEHTKVPGLKEMGEKARRICRELFAKYPDTVLLHGDLHHDNILLRADGSYGVIDPKGIIGPAILDLPRFLLNEPLDAVPFGIHWLSERLGYPVADIRGAYYVEAVLANLWLAEDGLPLWEDRVSMAEKLLEDGYGD